MTSHFKYIKIDAAIFFWNLDKRELLYETKLTRLIPKPSGLLYIYIFFLRQMSSFCVFLGLTPPLVVIRPLKIHFLFVSSRTN